MKMVSIQARRELLESIRGKYKGADWITKGKILDGFIAASGYERKYAIRLLNHMPCYTKAPAGRKKPVKYDTQVRQALLTLWYAANQICSKRLVPFLPELVEVMERHGHLQLPADVRERLLSISHATVDRILAPERYRIGKPCTTTRPGNLLKHQVQVRTFADWDDVTPGFLEGDLVAHCGGDPNGQFLNTLVLVDISTGWLECLPLLRKSAKDVIVGLNIAQELLPFPFLGLDTDNGSEFINHDLIDYCDKNNITFTRARAYRKNDQAHVEEKNGSVIRRLVGYDRLEGMSAWTALSELYRILRVYLNFFQPSMKLLSKQRQGAKVTKKYDAAKTPYQRVLLSSNVSNNTKTLLKKQYARLDPVNLLHRLEKLQKTLWNYSWKTENQAITENTDAVRTDIATGNDDKVSIVSHSKRATKSTSSPRPRYYKQSGKKDLRKGPRTWRTRKDPFEMVWDEVKLKLALNPGCTAKSLLDDLITKYPCQFSTKHLRTLQRRVLAWRGQQGSQEEKLRTIIQPDKLINSPLGYTQY